MWSKGKINGYTYVVKHFDEPSEFFGLNEGRISKLWIAKDGISAACYERGWDKKPQTAEAREVVKELIKQFG